MCSLLNQTLVPYYIIDILDISPFQKSFKEFTSLVTVVVCLDQKPMKVSVSVSPS